MFAAYLSLLMTSIIPLNVHTRYAIIQGITGHFYTLISINKIIMVLLVVWYLWKEYYVDMLNEMIFKILVWLQRVHYSLYVDNTTQVENNRLNQRMILCCAYTFFWVIQTDTSVSQNWEFEQKQTTFLYRQN